MTSVGNNSLNTRSTLDVGGKSYAYYSLKKAAAALGPVERLEPVLSAATDTLDPERVRELAALLERLPGLVGQLEVVGPDVRALLDRVDDLHHLATGLPGTRRLLRRALLPDA